MSTKLGYLISDYRTRCPKENRKTQKEMAVVLGKTTTSYQYYENNHTIPPIETLLLIGETLNIPPGELLSTAYPERAEYLKSGFDKWLPPDVHKQITDRLDTELSADAGANQRIAAYIEALADYLKHKSD